MIKFLLNNWLDGHASPTRKLISGQKQANKCVSLVWTPNEIGAVSAQKASGSLPHILARAHMPKEKFCFLEIDSIESMNISYGKVHLLYKVDLDKYKRYVHQWVENNHNHLIQQNNFPIDKCYNLLPKMFYVQRKISINIPEAALVIGTAILTEAMIKRKTSMLFFFVF